MRAGSVVKRDEHKPHQYRFLHCQKPVAKCGMAGGWPVASAKLDISCSHTLSVRGRDNGPSHRPACMG